jgi:selenium metabolism protein YedF
MEEIMKNIIDARGLPCPQPVIKAKKALEQYKVITVIVSDQTACDNVGNMAKSQGCSVSVQKKKDGIYLSIDKTESEAETKALSIENIRFSGQKKTVLAVSQNRMGKGDDQLGEILIRMFFHTLAETPPLPETIVFFNSGVKLTVEGSEIIGDLKEIANKGTKILICGTCLDFFKIKDKIKVGNVSNLYDVKEVLFAAEKIIHI